ncbi:hypothetical protein D9613_006817 [Agrocybe pediades]|uniref:Protein kinase domain-containing protein n=1 Tax=Agrocybe pediades TaxID=84607 RepID=A0A8H4QGN7_9AGAR|nr:hypothetical protein D9613_006817 [Agrocybe pediades]
MSEKPCIIDPEELLSLETRCSSLSLTRRVVYPIALLQPLCDVEEVTCSGQLDGQEVRLHSMVIPGLTKGERRQAIEKIISKLKRWRSCRHLHLLDIYGFSAQPDIPRLTLVAASPSSTVLQYMALNADFDPLRSCIDIATGLDFLHRKSIVHGAIRGSNILVNQDGQSLLGEFSAETVPTAATLERYANWIAPELVQVHRFHAFLIDNYRSHDYFGEYQMASDIFAMGCIALELYMKEPPPILQIPYDTVRTHKELAHLHRESTAREKQIIPERILGAISAMLSFVPHRRPQSEHALKWLKRPDMLRISACPPVYAKRMLWRAFREKDI